MTKTIKIKNTFPRFLVMQSLAKEMFKYINDSYGKKIILDFEGVESISITFAQEYHNQKKMSNKIIKEINLSDKHKNTLSIAKNLFI